MRKKLTSQLLKMLFSALFLSGLMPVKAGIVNHNIGSASLTIPGSSTDEYVITGSTTTNYVIINANYKGTITLKNLNISLSDATNSPITVLGAFNQSNMSPVTKVNVILEGTNILYTSGAKRAAFQVDQGAQIHISAIDPSDNASGTLSATVASTSCGAGIGAPNISSPAQGSATLSNGNTGATAGGNVIISSGKITAKGGHAAGIGGGYQHYYNGIIVLYGGEVVSSATSHAAGIGSGCPRGSGVVPEYAPMSAIIAIPPTSITATGAPAEYGLAGTASVTYIGDKSKPLIKVQTEGQEKYADIYADLSETTSISSIFSALGIEKDLTNVTFGTTGSTGIYQFNAQLDQNVTFFTDASSTAIATQGRPFKPVTTTASSAKTITLPLLQIGMSFEVIPATPLESGYTPAQAKTHAYKLKVTYTDGKPMTGILFDLQAGASTDFKGLTFYGPNGTSEISAPVSLNNGDVFYVQIPLKDSKPLNVYKDVLRISGTFDGAPTGYIRQVVTQRVVVDDTNTNNYIKVTASPATFSTNNAATATANLNLNISHGSISVPYDNMDVTAKYLITTQPDYDLAIAATPLSSWTNMNIPASDGVNTITTASFNGKPEGTYYIHWHVESGVIYAHSKTVVDPAATYGGFGPYIIDTSGPTAVLKIDGESATKNITTHSALPVTLTFNEAIKNPGTELTVSDFEILPAGIATLSGITLVPNSDDKEFTATLTPGAGLYNGQSFTIKLKANTVTDKAGNNNTASNAVTVHFSNNTKPTILFKNVSAYSSLRPSFTVEISPEDFSLNGNTDLFLSAGGSAIIAGADLSSQFIITPQNGNPLASGYTAAYNKSGSGTSAKGIVTITFTADLQNSTDYTIAIATNSFYNKLHNGNDATSSTFKIAEPDFTDVTAGLYSNPNLFPNTGGTTTLTIKGEGLKMNADEGKLSLRVACPAIGYTSSAITSGFTLESGMDVVTINSVTIPANSGPTTLSHTFELYMTFDGNPEISTGKTCIVQVEPAKSFIVGVTNTTSSVTDLTFGYSGAQAQLAGSRQNITVTNNGAQTLNNLTVLLTGPDGSAFTYTNPSPITGLAPGNTATFYVYLQAGQNAGTYAGGSSGSETKVSVSATPGTSSTPISGSAVLVEQKVNPKNSSNNGLEGKVVGTPAPNTNWSNQNTVVLTASALETGDFVKDWRYAVVAINVAPGPMDPVWTTVSNGTTATYTFPSGTNSDHYIFWEMNTNNITGITGQVENSGVKVYNIDLVAPTVTNIVSERTITNATPFKISVTFSEPVSVTDASKFVATHATVGNPIAIGNPVNGQYTDYQMTITPKAGLKTGDLIVFSVQANAAKDRANNNNPASHSMYDVSIEYNSENPLVTLTTPDLTINSNFVVTVTFSKAVTGLTESDFVISNGTVLSGSLSGSGTTYTLTINTTSSASGYILVTLPDNVVEDAAYNGNMGGSLKVDYRDPTDQIAAVLSYAGPTYENGTFDIRVNFSRNVTGLTAGSFIYATGDFGPPSLTGGGKNYILTLTPVINKDATTTVHLPAGISALDEYGNSLLASNTVSANYDTRNPLVNTITAVGGITSVNFDPFTVEIEFDEPNLHSFDASKIDFTYLDYLGLVSGPVTVGTTTKFEISVKVAPNTPSGSILTLKAGTGTARDKANNPNEAGAGSTPLAILFIDNVPPVVINVTPSNSWAPIKGNIVITFDEPINPASNGKVWLENFGNIKDGIWLNNTTFSFPYGYLANDMIYRIYISDYEDPAGNIMLPTTTTFGTQKIIYTGIQRPVQLFVTDGLVTDMPTDETIYVNSQDDFTFTVSSANEDLDNLSVTTGIPIRDKEGIRMKKNNDGSITVNVLNVTEALFITVSLGSTSNETIESNKVWAHNQSLYIQADHPGRLFIYTLSGILYKQMDITENRTNIPLPTGLYTVVYNGISHKIIIK